ncbi:MAG: hypothetical protein PHS57_05935 [Alphaproteobacteria bacterium]|nr:hypothetical protein [Alphaproteobacteria bacterium]
MDGREKISWIDIIRQKKNYSRYCTCLDPHYLVDSANRMVECADCGAIIDPFQALEKLANNHERINSDFDRMREEAKKLETYKPRLRVIKYLEERYSGTSNAMVPSCPHCGEYFDLKDLQRVGWRSKTLYDRMNGGKE